MAKINFRSVQTYELEDMLTDIAYELHMRGFDYEAEDMMLYIDAGIRKAKLELEGDE